MSQATPRRPKPGPEAGVLKIELPPLEGIARLLRPKAAAKKPRKRPK
jgi:hypothetical protein